MSAPIFTSGNKYPKPARKPGRVDIDPREFDKLIEDQGVRVRIIPALLCPNRTDVADTNHSLDCPICFGENVIDIQEECIETWAYIQAIKLDKDFFVQGVFDMKDAMITVQSGVKIYYWYRIEIIDFASIFNQLIKATGDLDRTRYRPATELSYDKHFLIDSTGKRYRCGEDFQIEDQQIRWITANRPTVGSLYSFSYPITPTFRVLELMHESRYYYYGFKQKHKQGVDLPQQAVMRWDYIANKSGSNTLVSP